MDGACRKSEGRFLSGGYSGTPLARKLGIRDGHGVLLAGAPEGFAAVLRPLPSTVRVTRVGSLVMPPGGRAELRLTIADLPTERSDVALVFCPGEADAVALVPALVSCIGWDGGLWVCWPKKSSPLYTDLARERVREVGLATGLVDNKVCAITEDWSGLRFVVRKSHRLESDPEGGPVS